VLRLVRIALVVGLLAATVTAFAVAERLKLTPSPIRSPRADRVVSPGARAEIRFRLRKPDRLTLALVDDRGRVVRTLVDARPADSGLQRLAWDGRDDAGAVAAGGTYRPRVHLARRRLTILLPNPIRVVASP
jgi:hypothetical protein